MKIVEVTYRTPQEELTKVVGFLVDANERQIYLSMAVVEPSDDRLSMTPSYHHATTMLIEGENVVAARRLG
ncbi:MAG: hypothetical protein DWQ07_06885 [Chloroflexi bacterium]|nr:MAG: hypothetical protein DWQ07_06885 [Chloroflexota bacterium]MBL1195574.1 hypothetical protein [Chloroflexota bacterium]NOH12858.1 hypothetical protein [Chloroflexota bacterium]